MKVKEFYKKHKKGLVVTGCVLGGAVTGILVAKKVMSKDIVDLTGQSVISWKPENKFMSLEKAKNLMDINATTNEAYAIFREGPSPDDLVFIYLNEVVKAK